VEQLPVIEETPINQPISTEVKTEAEPVDETPLNSEQVSKAEQDIPQQSIEVGYPLVFGNKILQLTQVIGGRARPGTDP
jgi:lipid-binding SYLF domain-containing protein